MSELLRLRTHEYVHVEDLRTCAVLTLLGPLTFTLYDYHRLVHDAPQPCVVVPPNYYVTIRNPVVRGGGEDSSVSWYVLVTNDETALKNPREAKCLMGQKEYRYHGRPFPLFPGEEATNPEPMPFVKENEALRIIVRRDYESEAGPRRAGEHFFFIGPRLYCPRIEEDVRKKVKALHISKWQALRLRALEGFTDHSGKERVAGEEWTERAEGAYFPPPQATVEKVVDGIQLSSTTALHVRASQTFFDVCFSTHREIGETWLVTWDECDLFIPDAAETVVCTTSLVRVQTRQYCVVLNPYREGRCRWGERELRVGPCTFFLHPGEVMEDDTIKDAFILSASEALLVEAMEAFVDLDGTERTVSARWLIKGPCRYIPPLAVRVVERRHTISLSESEGVYISNVRTGIITSVFGRTFLLGADEVLWKKSISPLVRRLLESPYLRLSAPEDSSGEGKDIHSKIRNSDKANLRSSRWIHPNGRTRGDQLPPSEAASSPAPGSLIPVLSTDMQPYAVVSVNIPHHSLARIYDTSTGTSRVVAGPAAVSLGPHEEFTPVTLSAGRPKRPSQVQSLYLFLGPDYMADIIEVETLDHARLQLELAYNWELLARDEESQHRAFTIPDFIGEACKTLASRVRAAIANETFEDFHRHSSTVICNAIFSRVADDSAKVRDGALYFSANGLIITSVDVQSVEPVDVKMRVALTKSVQLAVEIITKSQENEATHQATLLEQESRGALELQLMRDRSSAEEKRRELLQAVAQNTVIELGSASQAQAVAESAARLVEAQSDLDATDYRCKAHECSVQSELEVLHLRMEAELCHRKAMNDLSVERSRQLADIQATKHEKLVAAVGRETLIAMAEAGPELQARLLHAMGLKGFLVTDGKSPINVMNMAEQITAGGEVK